MINDESHILLLFISRKNMRNLENISHIGQPANTCLKLTIKTLDAIGVVLVSLLLTLNIFHTFL